MMMRLVLCVQVLVGSACVFVSAAEVEQLKVGMLSDGGRFDDAGYNQACKEGLEQAMHEFKVFGYFRQSENPGDYQIKLK
ncbi:MAG: hypothetical protein V2A34_03850, partial [Lentisphaerota bacterium]